MYYGFDIGGTKIALGVFDKDLKLQWETRVPTPRDSYDEFLTAIAALVAQADERFGVKGSVGIGIPGMPETDDGTLYAANVPAASGKPLRADLSALLERDVRLDNDANCFALSEAWDDEFRRYPLVMGLILGTGVGGGIVINGKPITGRSYITGEFGHIRLPVDALEVVGRDFPLTRCGCGQHGCIENYLSGRGFAWLYEHFYHQKLEAPQIITLWEQGDAQAREHLLRRHLEHLAEAALQLGQRETGDVQQGLHAHVFGVMRIQMGQGQAQLFVLGAQAVLLAQVARDPDQSADLPLHQQRPLAGQAPARLAVGEQMQLHQVFDHLAGQHLLVLGGVIGPQPGRIDLCRSPPDHVLARLQAQPAQHGLVDMRIPPVAVLHEEQDVGDRIKQGFDVCGFNAHAAGKNRGMTRPRIPARARLTQRRRPACEARVQAVPHFRTRD